MAQGDEIPTAVFLTEGGGYVRLDIPREGTIARERHDEKVTKRLLVPIDEALIEDVTRNDGDANGNGRSTYIVVRNPPEPGSVKRARLAKEAPAPEPEAAPADGDATS